MYQQFYSTWLLRNQAPGELKVHPPAYNNLIIINSASISFHFTQELPKEKF